jgi:hypothetical protein
MNTELKNLLQKFRDCSEELFLTPLEQITTSNSLAGYIVATNILVQLERVGLVLNPDGIEDSSGTYSEGRFKKGFGYVFKNYFVDGSRLNDVSDLVWTSGRCGLAHVAHMKEGVWIHNHTTQDPLTVSENDGQIEVHINLIRTIGEIRNAYERLVNGEGFNENNSIESRKEAIRGMTKYSTKVITQSIESEADVPAPMVVISGSLVSDEN